MVLSAPSFDVLARMRVPKMVKNGFNSVLYTSTCSRRLATTKKSTRNAKPKTDPKTQEARAVRVQMHSRLSGKLKSTQRR
jgi:hypothetical protein